MSDLALEENTPFREKTRRHLFYGGWLLFAGFLGLLAAFALTIEKIHAYTNPGEGASCDYSVIVQCSANLNSAAGSLFGFPNPLIGLIAWPFVIATAVLILARVPLPKFWWYGFFGGTLLALVFVSWLQFQSIMILGTLCPWCMVTWFAVIPTFWATVTHMGTLGLWGNTKAFFEKAKAYVPILSFLWFFGIALWSQLRLDWLSTL